jgi:hypothetical protein
MGQGVALAWKASRRALEPGGMAQTAEMGIGPRGQHHSGRDGAPVRSTPAPGSPCLLRPGYAAPLRVLRWCGRKGSRSRREGLHREPDEREAG